MAMRTKTNGPAIDRAGLGHVRTWCAVTRAQRPGGCPFQAWSLGETIRIVRMLALDDPA